MCRALSGGLIEDLSALADGQAAPCLDLPTATMPREARGVLRAGLEARHVSSRMPREHVGAGADNRQGLSVPRVVLAVECLKDEAALGAGEVDGRAAGHDEMAQAAAAVGRPR